MKFGGLVLLLLNLSAFAREPQTSDLAPRSSFTELFVERKENREKTSAEIKKQERDSLGEPSRKRLERISSGNEGGHGGDIYALEFFTLGQLIAASLEKYDAAFLQKFKFSGASFGAAVKRVRVVSDVGEKVQLRGAEVDAVNSEEDRQVAGTIPGKTAYILLNRDRWRQASLLKRIQLVMHEYFGILNVERDTYGVSTQLAGLQHKIAQMLSENKNYQDLLIGLSYGQCEVYPPLGAVAICDSSSPEFVAAQECSKKRAEGQCRASGKSTCQWVDTMAEAIISESQVGLRFCRILTVLK